MGVHKLSKKLRPADKTPDEFASSDVLHGKSIGIDLSVVLHKGLGTESGAAEFFVKPSVPNSEVIDRCNKLCRFAKANQIKLKVSVDGKYHPMKDAENAQRNNKRDIALKKVEEILCSPDIENKTKETLKLMKSAVRITEQIVGVAVKVFLDHRHEVFGAPYESDFQLVHWENIGFTDGTFTIDSDIWAMGSSMMIDLLNFHSAKGKCKILIRKKVQGRIMTGSADWSVRDVLIYSTLSGCDFIPRLFRLPETKIEAFMTSWKNPQVNKSLDEMLKDISSDRHWPGGNNKAGLLATDYVQKANVCIGLMMHAPVTDFVNGEWKLCPISPLPPDAKWTDMIGFDPHEHFSPTSIEDSYKMKIWARTGASIPLEIPFEKDPNDPSRVLPYGAEVNFDYMPVCIVPPSILQMWLHYHGVPQPKSSTEKDLFKQVQRARELKQPLEEDRIASSDASTAKSYISIDNVTVVSSVEWCSDGNEVLIALRDQDFPNIDSTYIDDVFGIGKNGVRERAWLRFESGHLNVETLRMATAEIEINQEKRGVRIYEIKVTPSMKNVVYSVYLFFDTSGNYLSKQSKCDCPNGWLFCSHTLSFFLLIYLIQQKHDCDFAEVVDFMPVPIKSLQSLPLAASYIFGELKISKPGTRKGKKKKDDAYTKKVAKSLAADLPGYSGKYAINGADAAEETAILNENLLKKPKEEKNIDLCRRVQEKLRLNSGGSHHPKKMGPSKVTMESIAAYNNNLVDKPKSNKEALRQLLRHERLHRMMKDGFLPNTSTIWPYLEHFKDHRDREIERLQSLIGENEPLSGVCSVDYDEGFLNNYFA